MVWDPASAPRVLLVEDDEPTRALLGELLESEGYAVLHAGDGEEGLRVAQEGAPQLVLLDLMLPKKSGWSVLEELKRDERTRGIPVIVVSAFARLFMEANPWQPDGIIEKPFDMYELLSCVGAAVAPEVG